MESSQEFKILYNSRFRQHLLHAMRGDRKSESIPNLSCRLLLPQNQGHNFSLWLRSKLFVLFWVHYVWCRVLYIWRNAWWRRDFFQGAAISERERLLVNNDFICAFPTEPSPIEENMALRCDNCNVASSDRPLTFLICTLYWFFTHQRCYFTVHHIQVYLYISRSTETYFGLFIISLFPAAQRCLFVMFVFQSVLLHNMKVSISN